MDIGTTGTLVDCRSPETIASHLTPLLRNRQGLNQMGAAGRNWAVSRFDWGSLSLHAASLFSSVHSKPRQLAAAL